MTDISKIFFTPSKNLTKQLKKELRDQGHHHTGELERSFSTKVTVTKNDVRCEGSILEYGQILNDGTRPEKASMKQFWFVKEFFISKGYSDKIAGAYSAMTINKWIKEGMSTKASVRFSHNGRRTNFIKQVDDTYSDKLNEVVLKEIDKVINLEYNKQKSETI